VKYCAANAPLAEELTATEVGHTAAFLASSLASGITGSTVYVDKGYHAMGMAVTMPAATEPPGTETPGS
jgi:enoyl-[acyl-carrier protein] reductase I